MAVSAQIGPMPATAPRRRAAGVPVLMYHGIEGGGMGPTAPEQRRYWVPEARFRAHLAALGASQPLLLRDLTPAATGGPPVVLTFDDGAASDYTLAFPLLQSFGAKAEFFVNPANVGATGYATWAQLRSMAEQGMSIQSHGWSHVDLSRLELPALRAQLRRAKAEIEQRIGVAVETLAVPYGLYNFRVLTAARVAGYQRVCTSASGLARADAWLIPRLAVHHGTSARQVARLAAGRWTPRAFRRVREQLVAAPTRKWRAPRAAAEGAPAPNGAEEAGPRLVKGAEHRPPTPDSSVHVFVLIDALGGECEAARGWLDDLLPYRASLETILGFSSGAVPTILTGQPPARTGHWNLFYYDPAGSPFRWLRGFDFLPRRLRNGRWTRKALTLAGRHLLGLGPLFECGVEPSLLPWFNWVEKRNIFAPGGINGAPSIFDRLAAAGTPHRVYTYHHHSDEEILNRAVFDVAAGAAGFYFLYLSELDAFLHMHCHDTPAVAERLAWYGVRLRALHAAAHRRDPAMTFTIFSDHGMTPVRRRFDLAAEIAGLGWRAPEDYLAVYDSTMARFWFFHDGARQAILDCLARQACGTLLEDAELRRQGAFFPDRRFGEAIFLLHPGWLIARSHFNGAGWNPAGMHGYHPSDPDSRAIFLSNREPGLAMRSIADIHACLNRGVGRTA